MAQEGSKWLTPGYGQMPMELGASRFWIDGTVPGHGVAVYDTAHNGGIRLTKATGSTTDGGFAQLNNYCGVAGDFTITVRYDLTSFDPDRLPFFSMRVFDPAVPGSPYPNSLTIQRVSIGGPLHRIACWSDTPTTLIGMYDIPTGNPLVTGGHFRLCRNGTNVTCGFFDTSDNQWHDLQVIVRNTVPWRVNLYTGTSDVVGQTDGIFSDLVLGPTVP
jgi:hypothetical protein